MKKRELSYKRILLFAIVVALIAGAMICGIDHSVRQSRREVVLSRIQNVADYQISNLIRTYENYTSQWGYLIRLNQGTVPDFPTLARRMYLEWNNPAIISIRLAPGGIVGGYVYPEDEEIYVNLFEAQDRKNEALYSRMTGEMTISGPLKYYPHEQEELIIRNPVYLDSDTKGRGEFWGFSILILDHREIMKYTELASPNILYDYKVRHTIDRDGESRMILESGEEPLEDPVVYEFPVADTTWMLEAAWHGGWITRSERTMEWSLWVSIVLLSTMFYGLAENHRHLKAASLTDSLTQVQNRSALRAAFERISKKGSFIHVLMFDIDCFKEVNDMNGHAAGDHVLQQTGEFLGMIFREELCFRYGGDEFLVFDVCGEGEMREKVKHLRHLLAEVKYKGKPMGLTISGGCVSGTAESREQLRTLLCRADEKLYEAKNAGKNGVLYEAMDIHGDSRETDTSC